MHGRGACRICVRQTKPRDVKLNRNAAFFCARSARARHPAQAMVPAWLGVSVLARAAAPVRLILDTDMGGGACRDVDDVVALCTLHAMMDNGEVRSRHYGAAPLVAVGGFDELTWPNSPSRPCGSLSSYISLTSLSPPPGRAAGGAAGHAAAAVRGSHLGD